MNQTYTLRVTELQNQDIQILSSKLPDKMSRKHAYVDFTAAMYAENYLLNSGLRASSQRSIFRCLKLYSDFHVVDLYCNGHTIYVISTYGTETVKIPLSHEKYNILPEAYIVVDVKMGMEDAEVKGVIYPDMLRNFNNDGKNYRINFKDLQSMDDYTNTLRRYGKIKTSKGRHLDCMNMIVPYIDGKLNEKETSAFIEHIMTCDTCKKKLFEAVEFDSMAHKMPEKETIIPKEELKSKSKFLKAVKGITEEETGDLKGAIDVIYNNDKLDALKPDNIEFKMPPTEKLTKIAIIAGGILAAFIVLLVIAFNIPSSRDQNKNVQAEVFDENYTDSRDELSDFNVPLSPNNVHKSYATVSKVSWEVTSDITDEAEKKFLQQAGKSIRLNLQNDLLLSSDSIILNTVKFDLRFSRDGSLDDITVSRTSGTYAVDEIIMQSIRNTLSYMRPPKNAFIGNKDGLTLVIEF